MPSAARPARIDRLQPVGPGVGRNVAHRGGIGDVHVDPGGAQPALRVAADPTTHRRIDPVTGQAFERPARAVLVVAWGIGNHGGCAPVEVDHVEPGCGAEMAAHGGCEALTRVGRLLQAARAKVVRALLGSAAIVIATDTNQDDRPGTG